MGKAHHTGAYQRARAELRSQERQPCVLCSQAIDYTLTYPHPESFAAEHVIAARDGGDHTLLAQSHLICQQRQGGTVTASAYLAQQPVSWTSGVW
jgi:hypothetical protein